MPWSSKASVETWAMSPSPFCPRPPIRQAEYQRSAVYVVEYRANRRGLVLRGPTSPTLAGFASVHSIAVAARRVRAGPGRITSRRAHPARQAAKVRADEGTRASKYHRDLLAAGRNPPRPASCIVFAGSSALGISWRLARSSSANQVRVASSQRALAARHTVEIATAQVADTPGTRL